MILLPILSAWVLGVLGVLCLWPQSRVRNDFGMIAALGVGVGFGLTSVIYYGASLTRWPLPLCLILEALVACGLAGYFLRARAAWRTSLRSNAVTGDVDNAVQGPWWLRVGFWLVLAPTLAVFATITARVLQGEPSGGWDAWAIWNMRARMTFRMGSEWPVFSAQSQVIWSHPDYPLLIPASVARGWAWLGRESSVYAASVSVLFALSTVGVLGGFLSRLGGWRMGAVGVLILLGTPFFVIFGASQYADIPLGFFYLSSVASIALARRYEQAPGLHVLAGVCIGLAAWTKNEGLLFAVVAGLVLMGVSMRQRSWRAFGVTAVGALVAVLPLVHFKGFHAPANDIVSGAQPLLETLFDQARHSQIASAFRRDGLGFGAWRYSPIGLMGLSVVIFILRRQFRGRDGLGIVSLMLLMTFVGYYVVYLITPRELQWHLNTSLSRLCLQLWPAVIFAWAWLASNSEAVSGERASVAAVSALPKRSWRWRWLWLAPVMACLFYGTQYALSFQLRDQELAGMRLGRGTTLTATAGDGWFGLEKNRKHQWLWSSGTGTLILRREGEGTAARATFGFSFGLRSLDRRPLKIMLGDQLVWEGVSEVPLRRVQVTGVPLGTDIAELRFISEGPGVPEGPFPDARRLAFAIYNFSLDP
jgi:hypothetical protein